jgi:NitT/TauT family transport system ATP-binding protein
VSKDSVISAQALDLTFQTNDGPVHALKNVSLDIDRGDFISFIGPSGFDWWSFDR